MFWSLVLQPGKKYSSTVKDSFHLSTAVVDIKSIGKKDSGVFPVQVEVNGQELTLCNLSNLCLQMNLNLLFHKGSRLTFLTSGKATIHLTGYTVQDVYSEDEFSNEYSAESNKADEMKDSLVTHQKTDVKTENKENRKLVSKKTSEKRKSDFTQAEATKKAKLVDEESSDGEDCNFDEFDESDLSDFSLSEDNIDEEEDSDDDVNDNDGSDEDLEEVDSDVSDSVQNVDSTKEKNDAQLTLNSNKKTPTIDKKQMKTPISNKKQDDKLNKSNLLQLSNGVTPKSDKKNRKNKLKSEVETPIGNESTPGTPLSQKKQTIEGGVMVEELRQGNGPVAKPGKVVIVHYTGRLKSNNRVFDQSNTGPGFKFRLGRGEVIRGWDVALNGMKVGSKRRITCPPAMAYGAKGSPPSIPPNSFLVFDVELKSVS